MLILGTALIATATAMMIYNADKSENKICSPSELDSLMGDGIILGESLRLSVKQSNEHILFVAPTGVGKSKSFMIPNINYATDDCSFIVTDPNGEIERLSTTDKQVYVISPMRADTAGYDPLLNCKNEFEVRKIARIILTNGSQNSRSGNATNQQDWIEMSMPLFTAYLLYCYHTHKYNFAEVVENICTMPILPLSDREGNKLDYPSIYSEIMSSEIESAKVEFMSFLQVTNAKQTLSSIRTVLNTCLQTFLDEGVRNMFSKPNFDFSKLRNEKSILFIQIPETHAEYFAPLSATLVSQIIDSLIDNKGYQVYMMFDEFANIGSVPNMGKLLSIIRKYNVSVVSAVQNLTQLERVYGDIDGREIRELFKCVLCGSALRDFTGDYIMTLLGDKKVHRNGTTFTEPLLRKDEIRRLGKRDILVICNNKRPVKCKLLKPILERQTVEPKTPMLSSSQLKQA